MEFHYNRSRENDLVELLSRLKKNNFSFELISNRDSPIEYYKDKYYDMLIYAYQKKQDIKK
jgi:hypothetical protein